MSANIEGKTLEYWITRATDPFTPEIDRVKYVDHLCKGLSKEVDGPKNAFRLFSYKLLSPFSAEVLNTLKAVDACLTRCGTLVHDELVRSDFLEQIVKILTPKVNGDPVNSEVRKYAISMLCLWQNSLSHISSVRETYKRLKDEGIIPDDRFSQRKFGGESPSQSRHTFFNDEEKTRLLSKLLKSKNPKDLQAANRLIRSLVQTEEQKLEEASKRRDDIEKAKSTCFLLIEMMNSLNIRCSSSTENDVSKELYGTLLNLRPSLFRYACIAADGDDNSLAEILTINDDVNRAIDLYKMLKPNAATLEEAKINIAKQSEKQKSETSFSNPNFVHTEASTSSLRSEDKPLILVGTSDETNTTNNVKCDHDAVDALTLLIEADIFPSTDEKKKAEVLDKGEEKIEATNPQSSADLLGPFYSSSESSEVEVASKILENALCDFNDIKIGDRPSIQIFDSNNVRGMLYYATPDTGNLKNIVKVVLTISSTNSVPLNCIMLTTNPRSDKYISRLLKAQVDSLPVFNPICAQPVVSQILLIYPLFGAEPEAEFDFKLTYLKKAKTETIDGSFTVQL